MNASGADITEAHTKPWPDLTEEAADRKDTTQP